MSSEVHARHNSITFSIDALNNKGPAHDSAASPRLHVPTSSSRLLKDMDRIVLLGLLVLVFIFYTTATFPISPSQLSHQQQHSALKGYTKASSPYLDPLPNGLTVSMNHYGGGGDSQNNNKQRQRVNKESDISIVTQMSINKIGRLEELISSWNGHISVAIYVTSSQDVATLEASGLQNENVVIHVVSANPSIYNISASSYPINIMRNIALDGALTDYVFPLDVDFIPSAGAFERISLWLVQGSYGPQLRKNSTVLIVPAFELFENNLAVLPRTKEKVIESVNKKEVAPFHTSYFFPGHGPTDFNTWYKATAPYRIEYQPRFEPYVVASKSSRSLPRYWEGFVGYGYNKLSWIMELSLAGNKFLVLPTCFVVHRNHPGRAERRSSNPMTREYFQKFKPYLKLRYNISGDIPDADYA